MPAHVEVTRYGTHVVMLCEDCSLLTAYDRSDTAQHSAREHNETVHAYPDPLPINPEETE